MLMFRLTCCAKSAILPRRTLGARRIVARGRARINAILTILTELFKQAAAADSFHTRLKNLVPAEGWAPPRNPILQVTWRGMLVY